MSIDTKFKVLVVVKRVFDFSNVQCSSCDFEAVPRVLKEHELLHFLPDELKFTSPEDIEKWREDRRKYDNRTLFNTIFYLYVLHTLSCQEFPHCRKYC